MSKVALSGNASGTGTFTIASPNSNSDRTLNLPDASGTILTTATPGVPVNGPAFSAYSNTNQSAASGTYTKIAFQLEEFDTNANFDTSLYRFTPTVAGYYWVESSVLITNGGATSTINNLIYKNGVAAKQNLVITTTINTSYEVPVSALIYLNGSTDYVEAYIYQNTGGSQTIANGSSFTFFQAFLARSAT